ncbi:hypothetical protein BJ875DRAFT_132778 [Amylocarpus encephaloides]|uniref:Uncharacterized protein n=1 Tax=Amylocarpus encephaloides TaxID=45428 RepID=A0A9P7YD77_9HELO|nr:hypothetical protein BJ875DRAFT_132778 [Amylocarpus encephaloides]
MSSDEDDAAAAAMAAAMGFSSFGGAKAAKKRKFNPSTDAYIGGQDLEKVHRGGKKGKGSGGNQIPLGRARMIGGGPPDLSGSVANEEETDADGDGEDGGVMINGSEEERGPQGQSAPGFEDEDGPRYLDTSQPAPVGQPPPPPASTEPDAKTQTRMDAALASILPPPRAFPRETEAAGASTSSYGLPQRRPPGMRGGYGERGGGGRGGRGGRGTGERDENWYRGYYDPAFNENPWSALEKQHGISSPGKWLGPGHWDRKREDAV